MQLNLRTLKKERKKTRIIMSFLLACLSSHAYMCIPIAKEGKIREGLYKPNTNMLLRRIDQWQADLRKEHSSTELFDS